MASKLQFLPLALFILFPATFVLTYIIALTQNHIVPFFAYISDTGTTSPESCIFGLLLNIVAVLMGFVVFIRHKQVQEYLRTRNLSSLNKVNTVAGFLGFLTCLGVSVVGCFQETNILAVHVLGAFMAFEIGAIYLIFQAFFTFKMVPLFANKGIAYLRLFIGIICALLFVVTFTAATYSINQFKGEPEEFVRWKPHHGGWTLHIVSVTAEWIMAALFDIYLITFMMDFRRLQFHGAKVGVPEDVIGLKEASNGNLGQTAKFLPARQNDGGGAQIDDGEAQV